MKIKFEIQNRRIYWTITFVVFAIVSYLWLFHYIPDVFKLVGLSNPLGNLEIFKKSIKRLSQTVVILPMILGYIFISITACSFMSIINPLKPRSQYGLIYYLILGLTFGFGLGLIMSFLGSVGGLIFGFSLGLPGGLFAGLYMGINRELKK